MVEPGDVRDACNVLLNDFLLLTFVHSLQNVFPHDLFIVLRNNNPVKTCEILFLRLLLGFIPPLSFRHDFELDSGSLRDIVGSALWVGGNF